MFEQLLAHHRRLTANFCAHISNKSQSLVISRLSPSQIKRHIKRVPTTHGSVYFHSPTVPFFPTRESTHTITTPTCATTAHSSPIHLSPALNASSNAKSNQTTVTNTLFTISIFHLFSFITSTLRICSQRAMTIQMKRGAVRTPNLFD